MNARGILNSSKCVNEVCKACVIELQDFSEKIFFEIQRAHQSCGQKYTKSLSTELISLFEEFLATTKIKLHGIQKQSVGSIAGHLPDKTLIQLDGLDNESERLLVKYRTEIAMYADNLHHSHGSNLAERLKNSFFNYRLVAGGVLVIAGIIALGAFTGAIQSISTAINNLLK
jgi:hypothetical protein